MASPDTLTSSPEFNTYATAAPLGSDVDLMAAGESTDGSGGIGGPCRRIRVGTGGDLKVKTVTGMDRTIPSLADGESVDIQAVKIYATGTSAQKITAFL